MTGPCNTGGDAHIPLVHLPQRHSRGHDDCTDYEGDLERIT